MRGQALVFATVCSVGAAAAVGLLVHDVRRTEPLVAHVVATSRAGTTTTVRLEVRSTTSRPRCADVQAVAQDRDGRDLGASPRRRITVAPRAVVHLAAAVDVSARDYAERFAKVRAVVRDCGVERPVQK